MKEIKDFLEKEKENLEKQLSFYKEEDPYLSSGKGEIFTYDEDISQIESHDRLVATQLELRKRLKEVKRALQKIEDGTYGICDNCHKKIESERLKANPAALFCLACSKKFTTN